MTKAELKKKYQKQWAEMTVGDPVDWPGDLYESIDELTADLKSMGYFGVTRYAFGYHPNAIYDINIWSKTALMSEVFSHNFKRLV